MQYWFLGDETNTQAKPGEFFVVGGLVFPLAAIDDIHADMAAIREDRGYGPGDSLKFDTRARPKHVSQDDATDAKRATIEALSSRGVQMFTYVILQDIAGAQSEKVRMEWALNSLALAYDRFLHVDGATGAFMMDRDDSQHKHLASMFQDGLTMKRGARELSERIKFFGMTSNNASHLSSAVDVALGGFRYCVNHCVNGTGNEDVARTIFSPLAQLMYGVTTKTGRYIWDYGYLELPKPVKRPAYASKYDLLRNQLVSLTTSEGEEPERPADADESWRT